MKRLTAVEPSLAQPVHITAKFMKLVLPMLLLGLCAGTATLRAQSTNPGDEVVVVYNRMQPESKALADYYAQRRHVPTNQVLGFEVSTNEEISRQQFRQSLQKPLAKALEDDHLWHIAAQMTHATSNQPAAVHWRVISSKIRYAVLCYGIPLKIAGDPNLQEPGMDKLRPEMRRNEAAVDSELALLPMVEEDLPLNGPLRNPVFGATNSAFFHPTNGVLLVSRLDGPTVAIARGLVDKAISAETNGLWGRAYFDLRNISDPAYKPGDDWIRKASEISRQLGFETVVDENPETFPDEFPMSHIAYYVGWYAGNVCGPLARPTVEFLPGAFAYHLFSYSAGTIRTTNDYWVGPLLARGATATMGCVNEPYLGATPEMGLFTARFLYNGFSFGEAAYASQSVLSWQTTVVGDPLYRPPSMANLDQLHDELLIRHSPWMEWFNLRLVNFKLANGGAIAAAVQWLEDQPMTPKSAVLTEKLGDLYLRLGKPSSAVHAYETALQLKPSAQQRVRLRLTLAEKLLALSRDEEPNGEAKAYASYQSLLQEAPDYPNRLDIYRKLLALAQKLNKTADANGYQAEIAKLTPKP